MHELALSSVVPALRTREVDDARVEIVAGAAVTALFLVCFVGWAAVAPLDAAASAPGIVKVSGERKSIQSLAGGIISALAVSEGSRVRAGQVLVRFSGSEALAEERSLAGRVIGLQAEVARLEAQRMGAAEITPPAEFAALDDKDREDAALVLAGEQRQLNAINAVAGARRATLRQRIAQIGNQISGYHLRSSSIDRQRALTEQELSGVESLAAKGYATQTRVLALKRSAAALDGDSGSVRSEASGLRDAIGEAQMQILQVDNDLAEETAKDMRDARSQLETALPQWQAAKEKLAQTDLRAPVSGQVVGLTMHTLGGVAAPGQVLMEIVPSDRSLTIDAEISVADANEIVVGQEARVRVTNLHGRQIPMLKGRITRVSADSIVDARTGRAYYSASVQVPPRELAALSRAAGVAAIRPGTPVDVQVSLRARSALGYWLEPLGQIFSRSLTER